MQRPFLLGLTVPSIFSLLLPLFLHPAAKDAKNHLTNGYRGGVLYKKSRLRKKSNGGVPKKIVRLILMSNISRRKFLKGAGVAALAVAAAGVLAGCSDQSTPDTGKKRTIKLKYMVTKGESIVKDVPIEVPALADTVTFATIQANVPADLKDYEFDSTEDKKIPADGVVVIKMHKKAAAKPMKKVTIKYTTGTSEIKGGTDFMFYELEVDENATALTQKQLDSLVNENGKYRVLNATELFGGMTQNGIIKDGVATVYVEAKN